MFGNDMFYFIGVGFFDGMALLYISSYLKGIQKDFITFLSGIALFNIWSAVDQTNTLDNLLEYVYFCCGIVFFIFKYAIKRKSN
jgi:hypothetical protein